MVLRAFGRSRPDRGDDADGARRRRQHPPDLRQPRRGATLLDHEHRDFTACIASVLKGRGLLFAGATTLNTRETIRRGRALVAAGADGLFLGRPMWMSLDAQAIVRFYADVAEALPGVPIIVYDNQFAFKAKIDTPTYAALSRIPSVIGAKHIGGPAIGADLEAVEGRMRILPLDTQWGSSPAPIRRRRSPAGRAMSPTVPSRWSRLRRLWRQGLGESRCHFRAHGLGAGAMFPGGKLENFVDYNIPIAHARVEGSGFVKTGPPRPPYIFAPEGHMEGGRETGRRWASLRGNSRYSAFLLPLRENGKARYIASGGHGAS